MDAVLGNYGHVLFSSSKCQAIFSWGKLQMPWQYSELDNWVGYTASFTELEEQWRWILY